MIIITSNNNITLIIITIKNLIELEDPGIDPGVSWMQIKHVTTTLVPLIYFENLLNLF